MISLGNTKAIVTVAFFYALGLMSMQASAAPDAALGKVRAQACFACHGENGIAIGPTIPILAAQPPLALFYQLVQFREDMRKGGEMEKLAKPLSDDDIRDIAAYFSALPPPPAIAGDATKKTIGKQLAQQQYCNACHAPQFQGQKQAPRLAGQSKDYFIAQLRQLRSGARVDMDGTMVSAARGLSDADIDALAEYAASLQ
jgi:cytochrome c553